MSYENTFSFYRNIVPCVGHYRDISSGVAYNAISLRVKVVSVSLVWITLLYCALFVAREWWMSAMFIAIALGVSIHILKYKTLQK